VCVSVLTRAVADAWIEENTPRNNKGDDTTLKVKSQGPRDNFRTLVRFDLPAGEPDGCRLVAATLQLNSTSWTADRVLEVRRLAGPWTEMGVTWADQPAAVGEPSYTMSGSGYRAWNVTSATAEMLVTGVNDGFMIRDAVEDGGGSEQSFGSRELESPPQLLLVFESE
jgi:hypothetical protein